MKGNGPHFKWLLVVTRSWLLFQTGHPSISVCVLALGAKKFVELLSHHALVGDSVPTSIVRTRLKNRIFIYSPMRTGVFSY
jgi:hypothetical protein